MVEKEEHLLLGKKPELLHAYFTMLAKKNFAEDIAEALDVNIGFLENLVDMDILRKPRVVEEKA